MTVREYTDYNEQDVLRLYESAGWTAYTRDPASLRRGFEHSLLTLAAFEGDELLGLVRAVGDGHTIVFVQDLLVFPEHRRRGVGTALMQALFARFEAVRQIELAADSDPGLAAFYASLGFCELSELGCRGYMLVRR